MFFISENDSFYLFLCCEVETGEFEGPPLKTPDKKLDAFINNSRACCPPDPVILTNPSTLSAAVLLDPLELDVGEVLGNMEMLIKGFGTRRESERFRRPRLPFANESIHFPPVRFNYMKISLF
jgi:hypothetical protein